MKQLASLVQDLPIKASRGNLSIDIGSVAYDSRRVSRGALFVAWRGGDADAHRFIDDARRSGAVAVIGEDEAAMPKDLPWLCVANARQALAVIADRFFDQPSKHLTLVGVTGTNGKTTVSYLLEAIFRAHGFKTGVTGTINIRFGDTVRESAMTTQESLDYQQTLREMVDAGITHVVSEISSHALALGRCEAVRLDAAIFTNLSRDHLDFHLDMESYYGAKAHLFRVLLPQSNKDAKAVINLDDDFGRRLRSEVKIPCVTFSMANAQADFAVLSAQYSPEGIRARLKTPEGEKQLDSPLLGAHNLSNLLAALACAKGLGLPIDLTLAALSQFQHVPGRLQPVANRRKKTVLVDYAHTPDALENVLKALKGLLPKGGKLLCLFGCGGDRDRGKRPLMAEVAARWSDRVILTSDNPRTEEPQKILDEVRAGFPSSYGAIEVEIDRRAAIVRAISLMQETDILLIAGKGHENYQIVGKTKHPFDDVVVAAEALETCA